MPTLLHNVFKLGSGSPGEPALHLRVRNTAAMALAAVSGATDAIGCLTLAHVFTSAMTLAPAGVTSWNLR